MDIFLNNFIAITTDPIAILLLIGGVFIGIVFGSIPGLTATLGVALLIPFTFSLQPVHGLVLLVSIYVGGISGGLITATLLNIPGTPSSIFTCFDGYPLAKSGKPGLALSVGVFASLIGGLFSALALFLIAPQLAKVSLIFGNWEYFSVALLGLSIVISMTSDDILKGLIGAFLGLLLGSVGLDTITGVSRLTFGHWQLIGGISATAIMMGLFAITEIFLQLYNMQEKHFDIKLGKLSFLPPFKELKGCSKAITIGSLFGTAIGILPGIGQNASTLLAYNQAKQFSKHPEKFGHGSLEGISASESSNNAVNGGALIPLVTLGIPGDMVTAALIGGLMIHGLQPGPLLFTQNTGIVYGIMIAYLIANFVMYFMELGMMKAFIKLVDLRLSLLFPGIIASCIIGVFALNNRIFDIWILVIFGITGYIISQLGVKMAPVILGFILGPLIERNFRTGMTAANGDFMVVFSRPIAVVFLILAILFLVAPYLKRMIRPKKTT